jgi:hypothetical protein
MEKTGKRIPIKAAQDIGNNHGYSQVIVVAWDKETNTTSVTTWGKSLTDCEQAAIGGNFVKKALGWPNHLTDAKPARVKRRDKKNNGNE